MKLGKLQKMWVEQLRKHPERQTRGILGKGTPQDYQACCLGELHLCAHRLKKKKLPFVNGVVVDTTNTECLEYSYEKYGLRSDIGYLKGKSGEWRDGFALAEMNDNSVPWTEIADFIEQNPEKVFTRSV